jgi:RNA polymerase sigma-70 factor, ECF subfamily
MALRALGNVELAEEVAQETIVRAFHALRMSRPEKLGAFVAGIARHVITDIIRAKPREVGLEELAPDAEPHAQGDPLTILCDAGERARVHQALGLLTPEDRDLLRLAYFEGLSPTEIAKRVGAPPERIRQRKLRALARLRIAFEAPTALQRARHVEPPAATIRNAITSPIETSRSLK